MLWSKKHIVLMVTEFRGCVGTVVYAERLSCSASKSVCLNTSICGKYKLTVTFVIKQGQPHLTPSHLSFEPHPQNNFLQSTSSSDTGSILEAINYHAGDSKGEKVTYIFQVHMFKMSGQTSMERSP